MYSEASQTSKMEIYAERVDCIQLLTGLAKHSILGVSQAYEYVSDETKLKSGALSFISQSACTESFVTNFNWHT